MKTENENKIEVSLAVFAMMIAAINVILALFRINNYFMKSFSIAISVLLFYYGWKTIKESEYYDKIKLLFMIAYLNKEARKEAIEFIKGEVTKDVRKKRKD